MDRCRTLHGTTNIVIELSMTLYAELQLGVLVGLCMTMLDPM